MIIARMQWLYQNPEGMNKKNWPILSGVRRSYKIPIARCGDMPWHVPTIDRWWYRRDTPWRVQTAWHVHTRIPMGWNNNWPILSNVNRQVSNIKRQVSNVKRQTSNVKLGGERFWPHDNPEGMKWLLPGCNDYIKIPKGWNKKMTDLVGCQEIR
jgi:hypothetical protein